MAVQCQSRRIQCCTKREKSLGGCRGTERVNERGTCFGENKKDVYDWGRGVDGVIKVYRNAGAPPHNWPAGVHVQRPPCAVGGLMENCSDIIHVHFLP
jgi:hypothetical protein